MLIKMVTDINNVPTCHTGCKNWKYCSIHNVGKLCGMYTQRASNGKKYGALKRANRGF